MIWAINISVLSVQCQKILINTSEIQNTSIVNLKLHVLLEKINYILRAHYNALLIREDVLISSFLKAENHEIVGNS